MPKAQGGNPKANSGNPNVRNSNPIFNKELGQHILKNPLVVQGIVEKVKKRRRD
jgi:18S rRNA (adenine1779-N6/adenine1780-N6)-dimethyltransferase